MSDSARDLLVRGVAFAKEGSRDEARRFLEWALRSEPDFDQRIQAWLWLSRISDDPAEQRDYLASVLGLDIGNVEARRELALLDGRLTQPEILGPRARAEPVAPDPVQDSYTCERCGHQLVYDPIQQSLVCGYCAHRQPEVAQTTQPEAEFVSTLLTAKGHRWELPVARTLVCASCGAEFALPPTHVSGECPYCRSQYVTDGPGHSDVIEPTALLPFRVDTLTAIAAARRWLSERDLLGGGSKEQTHVARPRSIYLPFWSFDIGGEVKWRGFTTEDAGERFGQRRARAPRAGTHFVSKYGMLVPGSRSLPANLLNALATGYDLGLAVPYSPEQLAGWPAEIYQVPMAEASILARGPAISAAREAIAGSADGEGAADLAFDTSSVTVLAFRLLLAPVWVGEYTRQARRHPLLVNGQTGAVTADEPPIGWRGLLRSVIKRD